MKRLTKDGILAKEDRKTVDCDIPEWGGTVRFLQFSAEGHDKFNRDIISKEVINEGHAAATLIARTAVNEDNERIFSDKDVVFLERKSSQVLTRLANEIMKLNGMVDDKKIDDIEKN